VGSSAAVIAAKDAKVLHDMWVFLEDLVDGEDFTRSRLDLVEFTQKNTKIDSSREPTKERTASF